MITSGTSFGGDLDDPDVDPSDPLALLALWLPGADAELKPLMTLSTIGLDGYPDARNVLLSSFDAQRIRFHTDARSRKVAELAANPRATATVVWPELGRQVVITGDVAPETAAEARAAYASRNRYLQLLAWLNEDATARLSLAERREVWASWSQQHPDGTLDAPQSWAGFALTPRRIVFWRGDPEAPSNRLFFERDALDAPDEAGASGTWSFERRAG